MARILVLLVGIAVIVVVLLMMFRGPSGGDGAGTGEGAAVAEGSVDPHGHADDEAAVVAIELLVEGSGLLVDDVAVDSVDAMVAAATAARDAGRPITLVIPGSASAATVTLVRDALERAGVTYAVSTSH